jgi:hypothetical protein
MTRSGGGFPSVFTRFRGRAETVDVRKITAHSPSNFRKFTVDSSRTAPVNRRPPTVAAGTAKQIRNSVESGRI